MWVLIVRNLDLDEPGVLEVEARIKAALPELEPRCTTVRESLYDVMAQTHPPPRLIHTVAAAPEHRAFGAKGRRPATSNGNGQ